MGIFMGGAWAARFAAPFAAGGVAERYVAAAAGTAGTASMDDVALDEELTLDVLLAWPPGRRAAGMTEVCDEGVPGRARELDGVPGLSAATAGGGRAAVASENSP